MLDLQPCGGCRRHVSIAEAVCPFCGEAREVATPVGQRFSRVSRAAVFAGAALASTACGGTKPSTQPVDNTQQQQQAAQSDAGVEAAPHDRDRPDPNNMPMPYGAPPARGRVV